MNEITELLLEIGLVQFGLFQEQAKATPVRFNWQYLPAYPDVLGKIVDIILPMVSKIKADRLLVPLNAFPLGLALSLKTNIPLIYETQSDLVGAYDTGHTVTLITNEQDGKAVESLIQRAQQVGLKVAAGFSLITILDRDSVTPVPWYIGLRVKEMTRELMQEGQLSRQQGEAIQRSIAQQEVEVTPRPDSEAP